MGRKNDQYAEFTNYVEKAIVAKKQGDPALATCLGCSAGLLGVALAGIALSQIMSSWLAFVASAAIGLPVLFGVITLLEKKMKQPKNAEQARRIEVYQALTQFKGPIDRRRLHKELDPVAGQLLEACSFYYDKARTALAGPAWEEEQGGHRKALKQQIVRALDEAMDEAVLLSKDCLGKPGKDSLKDKIEDALDLDIIDTVESLTGRRLKDDYRGIHRSPHVQFVFQPLREIAEKLKLLSSEVERMTTEHHMQALSTGPASSIDLVLGEIRSVRQAEDELDQQQQGQGF